MSEVSPTAGIRTSEYAESLEAGAPDKARLFRPWIRPGRILDVGTGPGGVAARIAIGRPESEVVGIDRSTEMLRVARERHGGLANLRFRPGLAADEAERPVSTVLFSSVLHEVFSGRGSVRRTLEVAFRNLRPGGRIIVRDFVRPENGRAAVILEHRLVDMEPGRTFEEFAAGSRWRVRLDAIEESDGSRRYRTDLESAYEYLFRKDSRSAWPRELAERYGFWSFDRAVERLVDAGFRVLHAERQRNEWVLRHRLRGSVRIVDAATGDPLPLPANQVFLVAERPGRRFTFD